MDSSLIGAWDLESNENINEYLKELGNEPINIVE